MNTEHERAILAAIKQDNSLYDDFALCPVDFFDSKNREVYLSIGRLISGGEEANDLTICDDLKKQSSSVAPAYVASLDLPTVGNAAYYAKSIKEHSARYQLRKLLIRCGEGLDGKTPGETIEELYSGLGALELGTGGIKKLGDGLHDVMADIEELYHAKGKYTGVPSGFRDLDDLTNGFQSGDLNIIACRPSIGKTALALSCSANMIKKNIEVGFFSAEMSSKLLMRRIFAMEAHLNLQNVRNGIMKDQDFNRLTNAANRLYDAPFYYDDTPNISLSRLKSLARQMWRKGVKIVFVDYITLIRHGDGSRPNHEIVGEISKSLKQLARELDIPIVALSQVGRDAEGRMPTQADLRQSGQIEEDADVIIFLHRDRYAEGDHTVEVNVAKNRNGATDRIELIFLPQYVRFEEKYR